MTVASTASKYSPRLGDRTTGSSSRPATITLEIVDSSASSASRAASSTRVAMTAITVACLRSNSPIAFSTMWWTSSGVRSRVETARHTGAFRLAAMSAFSVNSDANVASL